MRAPLAGDRPALGEQVHPDRHGRILSVRSRNGWHRGLLGAGSQRTPAPQPPAGSYTRVSAGYSQACGILGDGGVACWGEGSFGENASPSGTFTQISAGYTQSCGIRNDGTAVCWGNPNFGGPPAGTYTQVGVGFLFVCATRSDGTAICWGKDDSGQATPSPGSYTYVATGVTFTCGLKTDATLACWGMLTSLGEGCARKGRFAHAPAPPAWPAA